MLRAGRPAKAAPAAFLAAASVLASWIPATTARAGPAGEPRVGRASLLYASTFETAAGRTGRRQGILDGTVEGRFGPDGATMTAAFVRLEVTSRWPLATGADVRGNSGYLVHLVSPEQAAEGARVSARVRMGDSTYRLAPPRRILASLVGVADAALAERLPDLPAASATDLDGDGVDEILAFFRRQLPMSARPEARLHVFRIEGRAVVDALSVPIIVADVSEDHDFWGYLVAKVGLANAAAGESASITVEYARTAAAKDQRTDAPPPREYPGRTFTLPPAVRNP